MPAYQIENDMKMITIQNVTINVESIASICMHTVGSWKYDPLVEGEKTALDIRSLDNSILWTRVFPTPEEANLAREIILKSMGAGTPIDISPHLDDLIPLSAKVFE